MRRARAGDLDRVLHRLHQRDRIGPARRPCRRRRSTSRASASAAVAWSSRTVCLAAPSAARSPREIGGLAHVGELFEPVAHVVRRACGRRHRATGGPRAGTMAKASGSGVCATSAPRMLKVQATACGSDTTSASALSLAISARMRASLSSAASPAKRRSCSVTGPSGGAGRSVQIASIGLGSIGTSVAPAAAQALASFSAPSTVCSHGS